MYTRCNHCQAILPLAPADLAQAGGVVRCGSCGHTLNALSELYAYPPGPDAAPIISDGMPPLLTPRVEQERILAEDPVPYAADTGSATQSASTPESAALELNLPNTAPPNLLKWFWPALSVALLMALGMQLFGPATWRVNWASLSTEPVEALAMDEIVQVVSRDLHPHPTLDDAVIVSAVLVNRSEQTVRWPEIQVRLFDASQQVIGERRLRPEEYMTADADPNIGFAADMRLPLVLEMVTEASTATGFSLAFY
ncbi:MAG: zinc-ribbon and DUF3426 domain-containing protein [Pseudomonadota bacterium]